MASESEVDFLCFVDQPEVKSTTWQLRPFELPLPTDPGRGSRFAKLHPHRLVPEYEVSLYIDNSVLLTASPELIMTDLLPPEADFAGLLHSFRATVEDEFAAVVDSAFDAPWICVEQLAHYRSLDPESLLLRPLATGFMLRRHHEPKVISAMETWWMHILRYSRRDQLSFWIAARATGLVPHVHDLDIRQSKYQQWPRSTGRDRERAGALPKVTDQDCKEHVARFAESEAEVVSLATQLSEAKARVVDLEESTSWRVTKPFREISQLLRRPRG